MRRKGSYIAGYIIRDMKLEEAYSNKPRAKCKEYKATNSCYKCDNYKICSVSNDGIDKEEM